VAAGRLDFALFDAGHDRALTLVQSGATLSAEARLNPLAVIANYFFDTLPSDVFRFRNGAIYEGRALLTAGVDDPGDPDDPELIGRAQLAYEFVPVVGDYYADPAFDGLLRHYQANLEDSVLEFPVAALECLRALRRLAHDRLLLLSADRGYHRPADLPGRPAPALAIHGSFSMVVNYHALGQYVVQQGGLFLATARAPAELDVCAALLGRHPGDYPETRQAYRQAIERFGPDDFYTLRLGVEANLAALEPAHILAYLRLSGWDSTRFMACFPALAEKLNDAPPGVRAEWYAAVPHIWGGYYHLGEEHDLAFALGLLLYGLDHHDEALEFFERSLRLSGPDARTYCSMALCHVELRQWPAARDRLEQSLALDPALSIALDLRLTVQAALDETEPLTGDRP
jgi:tetratricopeptide (TPR) repeat protein